MATPAAVLDILVSVQSGKASAELQKFDRTLKSAAQSAQRSDREFDKSRQSADEFGDSLQDVNQNAKGADQAISNTNRQASNFSRSASRSTDATNKWAESVGGLARGFGLVKWETFMVGAAEASQAIGALSSGVVGLTSALAPLSGALVAIPSGMSAIVQAVGTGAAAFSGIGAAVKAMNAEQTQAATGAKTTASAIQSSANQVRTAEQNLVASHKAVADAQIALTAAREQARRELVDLRLAEEGADLGRKQAVLNLQRARRTLRETRADPTAGRFQERDAILAVQQAELDLQNARVADRRAEEDQRKAQRKGVEGSDQVVAAKDQLAQAEQGVTDATRALTQAQKAQADSMQQTSTAATNLQTAMNKLSPAAQKFARFIFSLKPSLDELRATAAGGLLPGVEAGIKSAMKNFGSLKAVLKVTADTLGLFARKAGEFLGRGAFGRDLERVGQANARTLSHMGDAALNLFDALRHVLVAARPFMDWLGQATEDFTKWIDQAAKAGQQSGTLADFLDRTRKVMQQLGSIISDVASAFKDIGAAARPLGEEIMAELVKQARALSDWTSSNRRTLGEYFADAHDPLWEAGRLLKAIVESFFDLSRTEGLAELLKTLRTELLPALTDVIKKTTAAFGPSLVKLLVQASRLFEDIGGATGPLVMLVDGATNFLRTINDIIAAAPVLGKVLAAALSVRAILGFLPGKGLNALTRRGIGIGETVGGGINRGIQSTAGAGLMSTMFGPQGTATKAKSGGFSRIRVIGQNIGNVLAGALIAGLSASIAAQGGLIGVITGAVGGAIGGAEIGAAFGSGPAGAIIGAIGATIAGGVLHALDDKAQEDSKNLWVRLGGLSAGSFSEGFADKFNFGDVLKGAGKGAAAGAVLPIPGLGPVAGAIAGTFDAIKGGVDELFGGTDLENKSKELQGILEGIAKHGHGITKEEAAHVRELETTLDLTKEQRELVQHLVGDYGRVRNEVNKTTGIQIQKIADPAQAKKFANEFVHNLALMKGGTIRTLGGVREVTDQQMKLISESLGKRSKQGRIAMAEQYALAIQRLKKMLDDADPATRKRIHKLVETYTHELQLIQPTKKEAQKAGEALAANVEKGFQKTGGISKKGIDNIVKEIKKLPPESQGVMFKMFQRELDQWAGSNDKKKKLVDSLNDEVISRTHNMATKGAANEKQLHRDTDKIFGDLHNVASRGLIALQNDLNKALSGMGIDKVHFGLDKGKTSEVGVGFGAPSGLQRQRGGVIEAAMGAFVRGSGSGDKVPAMLEPGEVVVNRRAVKAMGGANRVNAINQIVPRFQGGGVAMLAKGGQAKGGKGDQAMNAMIALANRFDRANEPYSLGGGHGGFLTSPAPVDCSGAVSAILHAGGLLQGAPMTTGPLMSWGRPATGHEPLVVWSGVTGPAGGHTVMSLNGRIFGTSLSNENHGAGWIEGIASGASLVTNSVKRTMDVGAGTLGAAARIARRTLTGPAGPLTDLGQKTLDKTRSAYNKYLSKQMPRGTIGGGDPGETGQFSVQDMSRLWSGQGGPRSQAHVAGAVGMAESGGNPRAVGPMTSSGQAKGLWQILGQVLPGNIFNPVVNAKNAIKKYQDAGGWSPWEAYTNGNYTQFLQRGGIAGRPSTEGPGSTSSNRELARSLLGWMRMCNTVREEVEPVQQWNRLPERVRRDYVPKLRRALVRGKWRVNNHGHIDWTPGIKAPSIPTRLAGGGVVGRPLPKEFQQWNKVWPASHSGPVMPNDIVAEVFEYAGRIAGTPFPGRTMEMIDRGEASHIPGNFLNEGNGVVGRGLLGGTTPFINKYMGNFSVTDLYNPIVAAIANAKMFKDIHPTSFGDFQNAWHGISAGTPLTSHWSGDFGQLVKAGEGPVGGGGDGGADASQADTQAANAVPGDMPKTIAGTRIAIQRAQKMKAAAEGPKEKAAWDKRLAALRRHLLKLILQRHKRRFRKAIGKYASMGSWPDRLNKLGTAWSDASDKVAAISTMGDFVDKPVETMGAALLDELSAEMGFRAALFKAEYQASNRRNDLQGRIDAEKAKKPKNRDKYKIAAWIKGVASLNEFIDQDVGTNVQDLQGSVKDFVLYPPPFDKNNPPYGKLYGAILDTQTSLRELAAEGQVDYQALYEMAIKKATEMAQRLAVSQAQYAVLQAFRPLPIQRGGVVGSMAAGGAINRTGLYLVGERGPEMVQLQAGGYVHPDPPSIFTATAEPNVDVGVYMHPEGGRATVTVNDRRFDREVKQSTRGYGRRPMPGAKGY